MNQGISVILGAVLPPFIAFLNKNVTSHRARYWIAQAVCAIIGSIIVIATKQYNPVNLLASIAIIATSSNVVYKNYWEKKEKKNVETK